MTKRQEFLLRADLIAMFDKAKRLKQQSRRGPALGRCPICEAECKIDGMRGTWWCKGCGVKGNAITFNIVVGKEPLERE